MSDHIVSPTQPAAATSVIEHWIVEYLRKEFPCAVMGPETSFSEIGLDSLEAVELTGFLENHLQRNVSPTLLYEYDTPRDVAAYLARSASPAGEEMP